MVRSKSDLPFKAVRRDAKSACTRRVLRTMVTPCSVAPFALENDASECKLGQTYGCFNGERKMWTIGKCAGEFHCDGFRLFCRSSRVAEKPGRRHNCSCFEHEIREQPGGPMVPGDMPSQLTKVRLVEGKINHARFVPNTTEEIMTATFTFWNLLDRVMLEHSRSNYMTGYVREVQVRRMVQLVTEPSVRTYCEGD